MVQPVRRGRLWRGCPNEKTLGVLQRLWFACGAQPASAGLCEALSWVSRTAWRGILQLSVHFSGVVSYTDPAGDSRFGLHSTRCYNPAAKWRRAKASGCECLLTCGASTTNHSWRAGWPAGVCAAGPLWIGGAAGAGGSDQANPATEALAMARVVRLMLAGDWPLSWLCCESRQPASSLLLASQHLGAPRPGPLALVPALWLAAGWALAPLWWWACLQAWCAPSGNPLRRSTPRSRHLNMRSWPGYCLVRTARLPRLGGALSTPAGAVRPGAQPVTWPLLYISDYAYSATTGLVGLDYVASLTGRQRRCWLPR